MTSKKLSISNILAVMVLAAAGFAPLPALAQPAAPVAGCDAQVLKTMQEKGDTVVAYEKAGTQGMTDAPKGQPRSGVPKVDSVMALTCYNSAAGNAAFNIGSMFSGDITGSLNSTQDITDALNTMYPGFKGSIGNDTGVVDYTATALNQNIQSCQATDGSGIPIQGLWAQTFNRGTPITPFPLQDDYFTGNLPTGLDTASAHPNSAFTLDLQQSNTDGDFSKYNTDETTLKNSAPNGSGSGAPKIPDFYTQFFPLTGNPSQRPSACNIMAYTSPPIASSCP
jgi:hypothetical protein